MSSVMWRLTVTSAVAAETSIALGVKVAPRLEEVLFKSLKIQLGSDGLLYEDAGYESMAQFNEDLLSLLSEPELLL